MFTTHSSRNPDSGAANPSLHGRTSAIRVHVAIVREMFRDRLSSNSIALLDQAIVSGANFVTSVLVGRWCGMAELGAFSLGLTVLVYAMALQESFIASPYVVFVHRMQPAERKHYAGSVLQQCCLLFVAISVVLTGAAVLTEFIPALNPFSSMLRVLGLVAPCFLMRECARRMAFAHFRWHTGMLIDLTVSTLQIAGMITLGAYGILTATSALSVLGIATLVGSGFWLLATRKQFAIDPQRFNVDLHEHWKFGKWLCADRVTSIASSSVMPWLVAIFAGLPAAGGLAACFSIAAAANPVLMGLMNTLLPRASHSLAVGGLPGLRRELAGSAVLFTAATTVFATALAFSGGALLRFAYGDSYVVYWPTLNVLSATLLIGMLSAAADFGLRTLEKSIISFKASVVGFFITFALVFVLVPSQGAVGAALAALGGEACASFLCWFAFQRLTNVETFGEEPSKACVEAL